MNDAWLALLGVYLLYLSVFRLRWIDSFKRITSGTESQLDAISEILEHYLTGKHLEHLFILFISSSSHILFISSPPKDSLVLPDF